MTVWINLLIEKWIALFIVKRENIKEWLWVTMKVYACCESTFTKTNIANRVVGQSWIRYVKLEITLFHFLFSMHDIWLAKDTLKILNYKIWHKPNISIEKWEKNSVVFFISTLLHIQWIFVNISKCESNVCAKYIVLI